MPTQHEHRQAPDAVVAGTAAEVLQDLQACQSRYPKLFAPAAMDPMLEPLAMAIAYGSPGYDAGELRVSARTSQWIFGLDWLVDHRATTAGQITDLIDRCTNIADGGTPTPGDEPAEFLAELRADLAATPAFADLEPLWRNELARMLHAMASELPHCPAPVSVASRLVPAILL